MPIFRRLIQNAVAALAAAVLIFVVAAPCVQSDVGDAIDFDRRIRPIFADKCYACHGPNEDSREGGFRIDQKTGTSAAADSGSIPIVPHDPDASEVFVRLTTDDEDLLMPPVDSGKRLTPEEVQLVRKWIAQGAPWQEHWSFAVPRADVIPDVRNKSWLKTPVDLFVLDRLQQEGLQPSPEADKATLLRRVTFDLTGLPPTFAELNEFLADDSPTAYERVVDRLLKSPRYGEHMARFWLDAARYGDTHGLHLDNYREMWLYRDWVVRAFNENLPFDQFIIKQLAGDLLPDATVDDRIATGFNRCHVTTNEGGSITEEVYVRNVVDRVVTSGTVFLGMTLECSRCHDHKYDPITMRDFYSLFAFFNSLDGKAMDGNKARHEPTIQVPTPEQKATTTRLTAEIDRVKAEIADAVASVNLKTKTPLATGSGSSNADLSLSAWIQSKSESKQMDLRQDVLQAIKTNKQKRSEHQQELLRDYFIEYVYAPKRESFDRMHKEKKRLEESLQKHKNQIPSTLIFKELDRPRASYVLHRGEYDQRRDAVERATPAFLPPLPDGAPFNRLGLSQWLVDRRHPLTARVTVNRLWQQVFGTGIVKTAENFGSQGASPSHRRLLDWLAVQFQSEGWNVKNMMKQMVMSATYRQASRISPQVAKRDPNNRLLARGPRFRLDAEMLRDQALAVSGLLVNQLGGPSVKPPQPGGLWFAVGYSGSNTVRYKADQAHDKIHRRSLYTFIKRTAPPPQMNTFDGPSRELCSVRRERTNTPLQALLLMNDPQYLDAARSLAIRTVQECDSDVAARIAYMFKLCTARTPHAEEIRELMGLFEDHWKKFETDRKAAAALVDDESLQRTPPTQKHVESLTTSELAAWTMIANLVLNLDEVINKN